MSGTIDPFAPVRQPVRTYGRRQRTPDETSDAPYVYQDGPSGVTGASPGLLKRFTSSSTGFLGSLAAIGRVPSPVFSSDPLPSSDRGDEQDAGHAEPPREEVEAMLRQMRRKQTAIAQSSDSAGTGIVEESRGPATISTGKDSTARLAVKQILDRSSSLTDIPSSSLPSSSPPRQTVVNSSDITTSSPTRPPGPAARSVVGQIGGIDDETMPIRAPGTRKGKRVSVPAVEEEEEADEEERPPVIGFSPTTPTANGPSRYARVATRSATPDSPVIASRKQKSQKARRVQSSTPDVTASSDRAGVQDEAQRAGSEAEDEDEDQAKSSDTERGKRASSPAAIAKWKQDFFDDLAQQSSDEEEDAGAAEKMEQKRSESIEDPGDVKAGPSKLPRFRAPTKKDKLQLQKDVAAAKRDRTLELHRPTPVNHKTVSNYMLDASRLFVKRELDEDDAAHMPRLTHGGSSPESSAFHKTPDDPIEPYSSPRNQEFAPAKKLIRFAPHPAAPSTDRNRRMVAPAAATLKLSNKPIDPKWAAEKQRLVEEAEKRKAALMGKGKERAGEGERSSDIVMEDDDSDLEIEPEIIATAVPENHLPPGRKGPDARRVLEYQAQGGHKQLTRAEQANLVRAGRSVRAHNASLLSETYAAHAGKDFGHHNARNANGGAKPAGQKQGRDQQIDATRLQAMLNAKHVEVAHKSRMDKEKLFGKGRTMPERQALDMEEMQELAKRRQDAMYEDEEEGEDEDDEDYVGSGDDSEGGGEDKENEEPYSGEERDDGDDEDEDEDNEEDEEDRDEAAESEETETRVMVAATSSGPALDVALEPSSLPGPTSRTQSQAEPDELETPVLGRSRKARKSRAIIDSDDEDEPVTRSPLAEINVQPRMDLFGVPTGIGAEQSVANAVKAGTQSAIGLAPPAAVVGGFGDFDAGGFGDDAGFSQLFDETQLNTASNANAGTSTPADGFAAMRATPKGFFVANAFLPENDISDTQKERDAALVAGEAGDDEIEADVDEASKQRYLNDAGLYTQTKPSSMSTGTAPSRGPLAGLSTDSIFGIAGRSEGTSPAMDPSSTRTDSPTHRDADTPAREASAVTGDEGNEEDDEEEIPRLTRLKRRKSNSLSWSAEEDANASAMEEDAPSAQPSPTQMSRTTDTADEDHDVADRTPERSDNAFQRMMTQARAQRLGPPPEDMHAKRNKQKGRSALVDEQAEESDEDAGWGPTERGADDDDEGNEDDGYVEGLVDDDKVDEALKKQQDRLAEEKMREIEKADDEKREAAARKVTEGEYRVKRKGRDFGLSDSEDEDGKFKRKKIDKITRRKMRDMRKEDVVLIGDEDMGAFRNRYEYSSDEDDDDVLGQNEYRHIDLDDESQQRQTLDAPIARRDRSRRSPEPESLMPLPKSEEGQVARARMSWKEKHQLLMAAAEANKEDPLERQRRLDDELGVDEPDESESQFMIRNKKRSFDGEGPMPKRQTSMRSSEQLQKYVADEAALNRPAGGFSGVSVINKSIPRADSNKFGSFSNGNGRNGGGKSGNGKGRASLGRGGSGILGSKGQSFAS